MRSMSTLLRVDGIEVGYGDLTAVGDVSLEVREGETVALIGANGAGKTTTLRAVSGLLPLSRGRIEFEGQRIDGLTSAEIVARGIAHVPEGRQLFPTMTVLATWSWGPAPGPPAPRAESLQGSSTCSRACGSGAGSSRGPSRAVSSRCAPSAGGSLPFPPAHAGRPSSAGPGHGEAIFDDLGRINLKG